MSTYMMEDAPFDGSLSYRIFVRDGKGSVTTVVDSGNSTLPSPQQKEHVLRLVNAANVVELLDRLREDEGASVTVGCDNTDFGGPNCRIEVADAWTFYEAKGFTGDTLQDALLKALAARENQRAARRAIDRLDCGNAT